MKLLQAGDTHGGFSVLSNSKLEEYRADGIRLIHDPTGLEVYHISNDDNENLFAFAFKTVPGDDTGVAHIVEHSVLCGSKNFPLKDPFLVLLKGSMHTFLNAFTFPDKTVYPASSSVEHDLFNLMKVYGDAVFFPLLKEEVFHQEGHRLEIGENGEPTAVGIVYNEMKGNYATHENILGEWAYRSLFPDTPYRFDSGGEPGAILDLSYQDFLNYHERYYHPSNCKIFLYGNIATQRYLDFFEENFLGKFSFLDADVLLPKQPRWNEPRIIEKTYPVSSEKKGESKASVTVNWLLCPIDDPLKVLSIEVLSEILLGTAGSPLEKALIESGLGEDLSPATGLETEVYELIFSAGLRGTTPDKRQKIEKVIFDELCRLRDEGIDRDLITGAIRMIDFHHREIKSGGSFALRLMRKALRGWLHGKNPEDTMSYAEWMGRLKSESENDSRYFEKLIDEHLINNNHRTTLIVKPDPKQQKREADLAEKKLASLVGNMSENEKALVSRNGKNLKLFQETPDSPEDIAKIPYLKRGDLPDQVEKISSKKMELSSGISVLTHDFFTNGVVYLDLAFNLGNLSKSEMVLMPLYASAITGCGLPGVPYDLVARDLALKVGGFSSHLDVSPSAGDPTSLNSYLYFRIKLLEDSLNEGLELAENLIFNGDFLDRDRMKDIIMELRNEYKSSVLPSGYSYASLRASRKFSASSLLDETWKGISQIDFLSGFDPAGEAEALGFGLSGIRSKIIDRQNLKLAITCEGNARESVMSRLSELVDKLPEKSVRLSKTEDSSKKEKPQWQCSADDVLGALEDNGDDSSYESLLIPSDVGYVATSIPGATFGTRNHALEGILAHLLKTGPLWEKIRMQGGAYGAFAYTQGLEGVFSFASYRDPNIISTLATFKESVEQLASAGPRQDILDKAVIGTIGKDTRPLSPAQKGMASFKRQLYGIDDTLRQSRRDFLLSSTSEAVRESAEHLLAGFTSAKSAVIAGKSAVDKAAETLPDLKKVCREIPL
jgi:presequence protease